MVAHFIFMSFLYARMCVSQNLCVSLAFSRVLFTNLERGGACMCACVFLLLWLLVFILSYYYFKMMAYILMREREGVNLDELKENGPQRDWHY